jgi:hypothetical protein
MSSEITSPPRYRTLQALALLSLSLVLVGCAKKAAPPPPPPPPTESILGDSDQSQESLFRGDQAVLSDQEIARILGTQVNLSDRHRLAILNLSPDSFWSQDISEIETKNLDNLVQALKTSPQLTEVRFLPSLLIPEKHSVPYLREAAARLQADLLLVYDARIQSFRRDRFLKPNEVHAQCVADSVLLDVRTGIVVQTAHATENIAMQKTPADVNFDETVGRAESEARGKALLSLAVSVTTFLAQSAK